MRGKIAGIAKNCNKLSKCGFFFSVTSKCRPIWGRKNRARLEAIIPTISRYSNFPCTFCGTPQIYCTRMARHKKADQIRASPSSFAPRQKLKSIKIKIASKIKGVKRLSKVNGALAGDKSFGENQTAGTPGE